MYGIFKNKDGQYLISSGGITKLASNTNRLHFFNQFYASEIEMIDLIPSREQKLTRKLF